MAKQKNIAATQRNLNPHAEAKLAVYLWPSEYVAQRGGVMDFWDQLSESRKRAAKESIDALLKLPRAAAPR